MSQSALPDMYSWSLAAAPGGDEITFEAYDALDGSGGYTWMTGTWAISAGTWYHVAVDFDGTKYRLYVDGTMVASTTSTLSIANSPAALSVGYYDNSGSQSWQVQSAYVDEVRVTSGVARYASDSGFTPPTSAFPRGAAGGLDAVLSDGVELDSGAGEANLILGAIRDQVAASHSALEPTAARVTAVVDQVRVNPLIDVIAGISVSLAETVGVSEATSTIAALLLADRLGLTDQVTPQLALYLSLTDRTRLSDTLGTAEVTLLAETIATEALISAQAAAQIIDTLGLTPVLSGAARYNMTAAEALRLSDSLARFFGGDLTDGLGIAEILGAGALFSPVLADGVAIEEAVTPQFILHVVSAEGIEISAVEALSMVYGQAVNEAVEIAAGYLAPNGNFTTWSMNTRTAAVSEYSNYVFNSFARVGNQYLGASDTGLYELSGDTDDGADIVARIKSGLLQFGGTHLSRLKSAYIATRGDEDFVLKIETGDGEIFNYAVSTRSMRSTKVHMGKGQRSRYFSFELISTGADFDLDTLEFVPVVVQRRV